MAHPLLELLFGNTGSAGDGDGESRLPSRVVHHENAEPLAEPDLVTRIRAGDVIAFRQMYLETFRDLWSFARRYVESSAVAEEIVQDVFLRVWERRAEWDVRGSVRAYLFGAVRNRALHVTAHRAVERRASGVMVRDRVGHSEGVANDPLLDTEQHEVAAAVTRALATLPERQRAAMLLRLRHGLSHAQIGAALGIAPAVAGRLVVKGEQKLRMALAGVVRDT